MSEDLPPGAIAGLRQAADDEVIRWVRAAIEEARKNDDDAARDAKDSATEAALQNGVTVDLTHKNIVNLPEEAVEVMKMEIERLAISHNRIVSFPARLAECHRLRYLNVRYNALKEFPSPILKLESLEILDLSRNRIRSVPEDIGNLTSLKVLAISRNKIDRLPKRLHELSRLQLLKFDDNPLVFPKPESYELTDLERETTTTQNELESLITAKVKRALYKANKKGQSSRDLDSDVDPAKTPRPTVRKISGRFPVKTKRDDYDTPITSPPDAPPVPSIPSFHQFGPPRIPSRSTNRPTRGLTTSAEQPVLWSPNQSSDRLAIGYEPPLTGSTLRSDHRSHAIITPRLPPSVTKLAESLNLMTSTHSSGTAILMSQGGNKLTPFQSNISKSIDSPSVLSLWLRAIKHGAKALVTFIRTLDYIRGPTANLDLTEFQLSRINALLSALQMQLKVLEDRRLLLPRARTPRQMNIAGRSISSSLMAVQRLTGTANSTSNNTVTKVISDDIISKLTPAMTVAGDASEITSNIIAAQYESVSARIIMSQARGLLPIGFFQRFSNEAPGATVASRRPYAPNLDLVNTSITSIGSSNMTNAGSLAVRSVQSASHSPAGLSTSSSFADFGSNAAFASSPTISEPPTGVWNHRLATESEEVRRNDVQDVQYMRLLGLLNRVLASCLDPQYSALKFLVECMHDKDQVLQSQPQSATNLQVHRMWHETAVALSNTLSHVEKILEFVPSAPTAAAFAESLQLQDHIRAVIFHWGDFCSAVSQIRRAGLWKGMPTMIPKYMQMIHLPLKEFSKFLKASPQWMYLAMDTSVLPNGSAGAPSLGAPAAGTHAPGAGIALGMGTMATGMGIVNGGGDRETHEPLGLALGQDYPSTPLGAALGPAAAAAMGRPNAVFMSRYETFASAGNRRF